MATIKKQVQMVFDLNKCLGCQTCTMACKTAWTDRNRGQMYMYWNNVECRPGRGYPKDWESMGGGFPHCGSTVSLKGELPAVEESYGAPWEYNYSEVLKTKGGEAADSKLIPEPIPSGSNAYSSNWDEDVGQRAFPNVYYFYLPRICNHCSNPGCVAACPRQAVYKREEDGIVLVDQNRCRGYRYCVKGCPYKKVYYNPQEKKSQKCIFCYPRIEEGLGNFCVNQCTGRIRWVGYAEDKKSNVHKLVNKWKVALRLHPEFGTEPNTFYIPPLSPPVFAADGTLKTGTRIPVKVLAELFGDACDQTMDERMGRVQEILEIIETERKRVERGGRSELIDILIAYTEADRIQV